MKLGDAKDKVWKILDEYSSGGQVERDGDISLRMNALFDLQQKRLARFRRIISFYTVPVALADEERVAYPMPADFWQPHRLWADLKQIGKGVWRDKSLILPGNESRDVVVEYYAYPADITTETLDSRELDIAEDACVCCCYFVAADLVLADVVVDSKKIYTVANQLLTELSDAGDSSQAMVREDMGIR